MCVRVSMIVQNKERMRIQAKKLITIMQHTLLGASVYTSPISMQMSAKHEASFGTYMTHV